MKTKKVQRAGLDHLHRLIFGLVLTLLVAGCGGDGEVADAYGNFEAVETTISAQADGELWSFSVAEGDQLERGQLVGQIDTVQLALTRSALDAQRRAFQAQISSVHADVEVLEEQKRVAIVDKNRIDRLYEQDAATEKQVDDVNGRLSVLDRQIATTKTKASSLRSQAEAISAQMAQITDQIERASIRNPVTGTVLATFAEAHEVVRRGLPLYRIADLSTLELRAYLGETQLTDVAIGDEVFVSYDVASDERETVSGTVSWVSASAEFTPRTVQTRDERTNLVYAFKIRVPNPTGRLKVGMPADVRFSRPES